MFPKRTRIVIVASQAAHTWNDSQIDNKAKECVSKGKHVWDEFDRPRFLPSKQASALYGSGCADERSPLFFRPHLGTSTYICTSSSCTDIWSLKYLE